LFLYTDSGLTTPAANGTYYDSAASANPFTAQVGGGLGQVQAVGICTSCECNLPELYEQTAEFFFLEGEPASACNGGGTEIQVYTDAATWDTSTEVFFDNEGETPATAGFYYDSLSDQVFEVDGDGAIISITSCSVPVFNPDAQAFFDAVEDGGDTLTDLEKSAVNTLVNDLQDAELWSLFDAFYPFVGGTATSCKWNLLNPLDTNEAFRVSWFGGMSFSSTGILGNSTNSGGLTYLNPTTLSYTQGCMGAYINDGLDPEPFDDYDLGGYDGSSDWMIILGYIGKTTKYASFAGAFQTTNDGTYTKSLLLGQNSGSNLQLWQDTTPLISAAQTIAVANIAMGIGCSWRGSVVASSTRGYGTAFFGGTYLTSDQITDLETAIVNFNDTLSR
jgi:hypothetical protein